MEKYAMFIVKRGDSLDDVSLYSTDITFLKEAVCECKNQYKTITVKKSKDDIDISGNIILSYHDCYRDSYFIVRHPLIHFLCQFLCLNGWEPYFDDFHFRKKIE